MKIYLNPEYKDHKKLERSILEEFPEISVKSAKYKGGKKKATFVYKETCYKFENRDDLLLTLKELLDYTERKADFGDDSSMDRKDDKKDKGKGKDKDKDKDKDKNKDKGKDKGKNQDKKDKDGRRKADGQDRTEIESKTPDGKDVLVVHPENAEEHVPTLKEILKSKDYEQIDEAFYGETAFEDREEQDNEDGDQTGSYEASLPSSVEKDDHEIMSDTFDEAENQKALTYEVEDVEDIKSSDIMEEMGFTGDGSQVSYDESVPMADEKDEVEVLEDAYEDFDKSRTGGHAQVTSEEDRTEGKVQPDDLMRELGYVETEEAGEEAQGKAETTTTGQPPTRKAHTVEDQSGRPASGSREPSEIVLEVPVEKYNLNDLNIKIKFGHYSDPSSTYETKKK